MVRILSRKTDNSKLNAKLALRRYFLGKYHADKATGGPKVIDACCGDGVIWRTLRSEGFDLASYLGIDAKRKRGRLAMDSIEFLAQPGWAADVLDIDINGSPWNHYSAALPNVTGPLTVFLTIGQLNRPRTDPIVLRALGMGNLEPPPTILRRLHNLTMTRCLAMCYDHDLTLVEAVEAPRAHNARYVGVRLEPQSAIEKEL